MASKKKEEIALLSAVLLAALNTPVPVNPTCKISKSKYVAGVQCVKREHMQVRHPELAASVMMAGISANIFVGGEYPR